MFSSPASPVGPTPLGAALLSGDRNFAVYRTSEIAKAFHRKSPEVL